MLAHSTLLIFLAVFQISTSQGPPPLPPNLPKECLQPPPVDNPRKCCDIPPIFREEDFQGCGFKKVDEGMPDIPRGPPDCSKQICLLKTRNLVKDDDTLDREAVSKFMDTWAEPYPEFKPTVESAKEKCLGGELPGPPEICDANKMVFCISSILFMCTKQICLLKTRNLVKDDDTLDREAVSKFMDTWAEPYPEYKPTVESAKEKCLGGELPGPPEICDANKMVFCISSILFMECPKWKNELEDCRALKNQIDTCEKYFPQ